MKTPDGGSALPSEPKLQNLVTPQFKISYMHPKICLSNSLMSPKIAKLGFTFITLISIPLSIYAVVSTANLIHSIVIHADPILFDSSNLYFILASVFWPMALAEYTGTKEKMRWFIDILSAVLIVWFIVCISIGALGNWTLKTTLEAEGYVACKNPQSISRISRTESLIYRLDGCES